MGSNNQSLDQRTEEILARMQKKHGHWLGRARGPRVRTSRWALLCLFISGMLFGSYLSGQVTALIPCLLVIILFFFIYME